MQSGPEPQDVDTVYGSSSVVLHVCDIVTVKPHLQYYTLRNAARYENDMASSCTMVRDL